MRHIFLTVALLFLAGHHAYSQQKQGHAIRPISKGMGHPSVIGYAQVEVMYALNATDINDKNTYIDLHVLRAGKDISKHYSRFVELNDSLYDDFNNIHKLQVAANRDYSKAGGARDPKTGQLISKVTPYEPLELE